MGRTLQTRNCGNVAKIAAVLLLSVLPRFLQAQSCAVSDSLTLVGFYTATGGTTTWASPWTLTKPVKYWMGVTLSPEGRVTGLALQTNTLTGYLPDLNLPELKTLRLGSNRLKGSIPDFKNLPNLVELYLAGNEFTGNLPTFKSLRQLAILNVSNNMLFGAISRDLGTGALKELNLSNNKFSGTIPEFKACAGLQKLNLADNRLEGSIPQLKYNQLIDLNLSGNLLTGAIPNFDGIPNLKTLTLSRNALVGPVPNFQRFPHLQRMTIDHNKLNGELPDFTNLPSLRDMDLSFNQLSGKIPLMARLTVKSKVDLTHNNLNFNGLDAHIGLGTGLDKTYDIFYANQNPAALKKSGNLLFFDAGDETPNMQYTWYKNDTVLLLNQRNGSSLFISSSGDYKCVATNLAVGGFSVSSTREKAVYKPEDEIVMKTETASSLYQNRLKLGGAINVAIPRQGKYIFKLMDSQNKEILKSDQNISFSQRKACSFSLTGVPVGFYYLKVTGPNNYQTYYHFAIE